ncbi:conserved protein, unknown function, partial [Hepatocystis sp. ex Piliocolobus tephrosceles]
MGYTFKFYKHKHLLKLKEKWKYLDRYMIYCLNNIKAECIYNNKINEEDVVKKGKIEHNSNIEKQKQQESELVYSDIVNILQQSSMCITTFDENNNKDDVNSKNNIIGITSLDYELNIFTKEKNKNKQLELNDFYTRLSLFIKRYNIISTPKCNNTLIINLLLTNDTKYYDDLYDYIFSLYDNVLFILLLLSNENNTYHDNTYHDNMYKKDNNNSVNENVIAKGLVVELKKDLNIKNSLYNKVIVLNKYFYVNKFFLRLTISDDIYDLHELLKKYSSENINKENDYLIYNIIENKTDLDILISILNSKKKIIGFAWLKKNIDLNILVNLYNLKDYNYLMKKEFFSEISKQLKSYKSSDKNLKKKKKKYMFVEFKQYILKNIKLESLDCLEKKYEIKEELIYEFLSEHIIHDVDIYADYFIKQNIDINKLIKNIYSKLEYDYEHFKRDSGSNIHLASLNKLISLCSHISFTDVAKVCEKFHKHFEKIEMLYFNFNNDKTYKKIYENIKKLRHTKKNDESFKTGSKRINTMKMNRVNSIKKSQKDFKDVITLSYYDIFLLLENIYPDTFKKNEIILLFLFLDLYDFISIDELTPFDCIAFKQYLDELVNIRTIYFICKYKHVDWLRNLNQNEKNAFSLNLFILNDKYYNNCKEILLRMENIFFNEVDYIIATNNERMNIPLILNYFNRVKKKNKNNTLESLYILNKYTLFLLPYTDYMKLGDIDKVFHFLKNVNHSEKNKINQIIAGLKEFIKKKTIETFQQLEQQHLCL